MKRERLDFLADNAHFTKRFAFYVGRRCQQASIRDVARDLKLDWDTVKTLEQQYMRAQLRRAGTPAPQAIGIDEIAVRKGHSYRIVVSDLVRKRPIWFGGTDRSEANDRRYIKGQKYTLLSRRENLTLEGRQALKTLLRANKRLNTAYLLKESFGQLWGYQREGFARRFFENWRAALKWQRLQPYEKFADMIDRHWDGIAAYCKPENKVSLGFVEGLNNKIRVFQRRAYGLRDQEYLRLKVLTCMLPPL